MEDKSYTNYKNTIQQIRLHGIVGPSPMVDESGNEVETKSLFGVVNRFDMSSGRAPIITERDISKFWKNAVGELFGFINGAQTQSELEKYGCKWWKAWVTPKKCAKRGLETGDLGPGSYGAAFANFPTNDGGTFNQFKEIEKQMRERPELKTHFITPWIPQYTIRNSDHQQKVVVCPCHGWVHFRIIDDTLHMTMFQRSCDVMIGMPSNWAQYSALLMAMADVLGLKCGQFVHMVSDAHLYMNQTDAIAQVLIRDSRPFPKMRVVNHHDTILDYRPEDFAIEGYNPHPPIKKIPVGV